MKPIASIANSESSRRLLELDSVRGLAALSVLLTHLPRGFWFGATGVDCFFVLSGYLITSIIMRNCQQPSFLRAFYYRRALRIFPIYYLSLVAVLGINALRSHPSDATGIWYYFCYLQNVWNYWGGAGPHIDLPLSHTWTLAIEEQFYLIWPAIIMFFGKRRFVWVCLALFILPVLLRLIGLDRATLLGHTDGLALGAMLAVLGYYTPTTFSPSKSWLYVLITISGFVSYFLLWRYLSDRGTTGNEMLKHPVAISVISLAYMGLVGFTISIAGSRISRVLRLSPLVWIGTISYGLYLYHWIAYETVEAVVKFRWGFDESWWLDVAKVAATFFAAATSWYVIERPLMRLKDRVSYRQISKQCQELSMTSDIEKTRALSF